MYDQAGGSMQGGGLQALLERLRMQQGGGMAPVAPMAGGMPTVPTPSMQMSGGQERPGDPSAQIAAANATNPGAAAMYAQQPGAAAGGAGPGPQPGGSGGGSNNSGMSPWEQYGQSAIQPIWKSRDPQGRGIFQAGLGLGR